MQVAGSCVPLSFQASTAGHRVMEQRHPVDAFLQAACCGSSRRCCRDAIGSEIFVPKKVICEVGGVG